MDSVGRDSSMGGQRVSFQLESVSQKGHFKNDCTHVKKYLKRLYAEISHLTLWGAHRSAVYANELNDPACLVIPLQVHFAASGIAT